MRDRETSTVFTASAGMLRAAVIRVALVLAAHTHFEKKETVVARPKKVIETKEKNLWGLGQRRRCARSVILSRLLCWSKQRRICAPCVRKLLKIPRERAVTAERAVNPTSALQLNSRRERHSTQDETIRRAARTTLRKPVEYPASGTPFARHPRGGAWTSQLLRVRPW